MIWAAAAASPPCLLAHQFPLASSAGLHSRGDLWQMFWEAQKREPRCRRLQLHHRVWGQKKAEGKASPVLWWTSNPQKPKRAWWPMLLLQGDVFFYYGLRNFHQNLRRYMDSRDDTQTAGRKKNLKVSPTIYFSVTASTILSCIASLWNKQLKIRSTDLGSQKSVEQKEMEKLSSLDQKWCRMLSCVNAEPQFILQTLYKWRRRTPYRPLWRCGQQHLQW